MTKMRAPDIAFAISGVSVAVSLLATSALPGPDIPGIVLVLTGGLACLLSLRQRREREFQILGISCGATPTSLNAFEIFIECLQLPNLTAFL